jgi:hypothetical protein
MDEPKFRVNVPPKVRVVRTEYFRLQWNNGGLDLSHSEVKQLRDDLNRILVEPADAVQFTDFLKEFKRVTEPRRPFPASDLWHWLQRSGVRGLAKGVGL